MGRWTLIALIGTVLAGSPDAPPTEPPALPPEQPFPGTVVGDILTFRLAGASGVVYHPIRKTLFIADDWGDVYETDLTGKRLKGGKPWGFVDSEGLTVDPATGLLYMVTEGTDSILEIDPETLTKKRAFTVPRKVNGTLLLNERQPGLEGITFKPDAAHPEGGTFFIANQGPLTSKDDIAAIFELDVPLKSAGPEGGQARIRRYFRPGIDDLAGLQYDAVRDRLYIITGMHHRLLEATPEGKVLAVYRMPPESAGDQEGITFDAADGLYVALDGGGLIKLRWVRSAPATRPAHSTGGSTGK